MVTSQAISQREAAPVAANPALQKIGSIVALLLGLFDAVFLAAFLFVLPGLGFEVSMFRDPPRFVAFVNDHYSMYYAIALLGVLVTPTIGILVAMTDLLVLFGLPFGKSLMAIWFLAVGIVLVAGKAPEARKMV